MLKKTFITLLWASMLASAAAPNFLLGFDYTEWLPDGVRSMATDASGAVYLVSGESSPVVGERRSSITKLSADGKSIIWKNQLPVDVYQMAVNAGGDVFVIPIRSDGAVTVAKLDPGGSGLAWTSSLLVSPPPSTTPMVLAVDATGRSYVSYGPKLVRLSADGNTVDYSIPAGGQINSIAADATGAAFITAFTTESVLIRFAPDGSVGFQVTLPREGGNLVALDANGNAVVNTGRALLRFDANGGVIASTTIDPPPSQNLVYSSVVLDKAGNAYTTGTSTAGYYPVKNTLAPCGRQFLKVTAPDGTVLQTTYLPGVGNAGTLPASSIGKDGNVLMLVAAGNSIASRMGPLGAGPGPGSSFPGSLLLSLSPTATSDTFPLACISNAGSYTTGAVTAGELVTLFGNGMGPQQGAQPTATLDAPYPTRFADVQVTFDGKPAPILYAQDGQVNVVVPWSLDKSKNTQVCVTYQSVSLKCLSWPTAEGAPGVFMSSNPLAAIALNQDGTANSQTNPAAPGSLVSVFVNGLGTVTPQPVDGSLINLPLPRNFVPATVQALVYGIIFPRGGAQILQVPAEVTYYGPAPFRVAGISQVNFRLNTQPGLGYQVSVGGLVSQTFAVFVGGQ